jgi:hypothetical protein
MGILHQAVIQPGCCRIAKENKRNPEMMNNRLILMALLLVGTVSAMAQKQQQKEISDEERTKMFVNNLAKKIDLNKDQKDSVTIVYNRFIDDLMKYRAGNDAKVISYLIKTRDEQVKNILRDDKKYDQYLLYMENLKKQRGQQQPPPQQQQPQGGQHNPIGGGPGQQNQ